MSPHVHPSNCHQGSIKGANLQPSRLWPASALPLSFVFSTVVSASALIIDVSPCIRQTMMDRPWEVCRAAGWGSKQAPTHCVGLKLPRKATGEQRGSVKRCRKRLKEHFIRWTLSGNQEVDSNGQCVVFFLIHIDYQYFVIAVVTLDVVMGAEITSALTQHASRIKTT